MMPAAKFFDPVMGVDIHIIQPPGPVPPVPIPHPFIGYFLDLTEYLPFIGATVMVNGVPRVQAGTGTDMITGAGAIIPHIPIGGTFIKPIDNECEMFMGSTTVVVDGEPFSYLALPVLSCSCIGLPPPLRPKKDEPSAGLKLPMSVVMPIPAGPPVLVGGPPTISMMAMAFKALFIGLPLLRKINKIDNMLNALGRRLKSLASKIANKLGIPPGLQARVQRFICTHVGEPVDVATGTSFTEAIDFELSGPIPLKWERVYYSSSNYNGPLGYGWHHCYDLALTEYTEEEVVAVRLEDGRLAGFPKLPLGGSYFDRREKLTLLRDQEGYLLRKKEGLYYRFKPILPQDEIQRLVSIENHKGHQIRFDYNALGHLKQIVDSAGRLLEITCDHIGKIHAIYGPHPDNQAQNIKLVAYVYDHSGDLTAVMDALNQPYRYFYQQHLLVKHTNRNGLSFYHEYDGNDENARCIRTWGDGNIYYNKLMYHPDQRFTIVENSLGHKTYYYYNEQGVVTEVIDALGNSSQTRYNEYNEVLEEVNELGLVTRYTYDERGNQSSIIFPDDAIVQHFYDEEDQLVQATDAVGGQWHWRYDKQGNLLERLDCLEQLTTYAYQQGLLIGVADPLGNVTQLGYDVQYNLTKLTTPDGATSRWQYDRLGRCVAVTDPKGNVQRRVFDLLGRVVQVDEPDGNRRIFRYDGMDNVLQIQDSQYDVKFTYTSVSRLASRTEAGTTVEFHYDTEDQLIGIKNEHGFVYRFEVDPLGNVVKEIGFDLQARIYERNEAGQITLVRRPKERWTKYDYDRAGRLTGVTYHDETKEDYEYRTDGELMQAKNQHQIVGFERDLLGRVTKEIQGDYEINSSYDLLGRRITLSSSLGAELDVTRNIMGDVKQLSVQSGEETVWQANFQRDLMGLEIERSLPGGIRSHMQRDKLGRPIQHQITGSKHTFMDKRYEWDVNDRLRKIIDAQHGTTTFTHDVIGNLAGAQYSDGTFEFRMPDAVGNLFRTRDRSDRKYGPAGQLLEANGTRYEYDAEGNLIKKTEANGKTWHYTWNTSGMLAKVIRPDGAEVTFTYDALGRRLSKTYRGSTTRWVWDGNVPLHEWTEDTASADQAQPLWKALHQTVQQEELVTTAPTNGPPADLTTWIFEPESFAPVAKLQGEQHYSIVTNYLGTPTRMFSEQGEQIWAAETSIYGRLRNLQGDRNTCPFRYPGQYEDEETGLYYNRFRYYDPESGEYVSQDPIRVDGGIKLYGYVYDANLRIDVLGLIGDYGQMPVMPGHQRHHIIPQSMSHPVLTQIGHDTHTSRNIIQLPTSSAVDATRTVHLGRHNSAYDNMIRARLDAIHALDASDDIKRMHVNALMDDVRDDLRHKRIHLNSCH